MEKSRILIVHSESDLPVAEKLRDELQTDFCEAYLWSIGGTSRPKASLTEMLESAIEQYDFAVLAPPGSDLISSPGADPNSNARDSYIFMAGLFRALIGKDRSFIVSSVEEAQLPSPFAGITTIHLGEPDNPNESTVLAPPVAGVALALKESIKAQGRSPYRLRVPANSPSDLWQRERPRSDGGDLRPGDAVVVCDTQPIADERLAVQIRRNLESGVSYSYFLHFSHDTIDKVCQSLQVISAAGIGEAKDAIDYDTRAATIATNGERVVADLKGICDGGKLHITLLLDEPQFAFRVHNASNRTLACVYVRYSDRWFMPWAQGPRAQALWHSLPNWVAAEGPSRLFVPLKIKLDKERKTLFKRSLDRALGTYFPGIEDKIREICTGTQDTR